MLTFEASALSISAICIGPPNIEWNEQLVVERRIGDVNFVRRNADNGTCSWKCCGQCEFSILAIGPYHIERASHGFSDNTAQA